MFKKKHKLNLNREEIDSIRIVFKNGDRLNLSCKEIDAIRNATIMKEKEVEKLKAFENKPQYFDSENLMGISVLFMSAVNGLFISSFVELDFFDAVCIAFPISTIIVLFLFFVVSWLICRK